MDDKEISDTNQMFGFIRYVAERENSAVYQYLTQSHFRHVDEPVGKHEPESVPSSYAWKISPMSGINGYAASRVLIEVREKNKSSSPDYGLAAASDSLIIALREASTNPGEFLPRLSKWAVYWGVDPIKILEHVYPNNILEEQNCRTAFVKLAKSLDQYAPDVWKTYLNLSDAQKRQLAIAEVPTIRY